MSENSVAISLKEVAKRRGFFFQSAEAYGGVSGFYTFGPQGAALKSNVEDAWRDRFTYREGHQEIDAPTIMPEPVFEASGHLDGFDDMIIECPECEASHRADHLVEDNTDIEEAESYTPKEIADIIAENDITCPSCGASLEGQDVEDFNLMFGTNIGPGSSTPGYLRPETAQGIFVEFPMLKEYAREQLPFGITQIGRAYRNEISPRKGLVRVREFTQAELEHFLDHDSEPNLDKVAGVNLKLYPAERQGSGEMVEMTVVEAVEDDVITNDWIAYYLGTAKRWYERIGVDMERFRFRQHQSGERAHYASDCWDAEANIGTEDDPDWIEIAGFAHRGDYDLSKHGEYSKEDFTVFREYDEPVMEEVTVVEPDMGYLGPEFGGEARKIAERIEENITEEGNDAFENGEITVELDGKSYSVPEDRVEFRVEDRKKTGEHITPEVVEPSFGVDRIVYTVLVHAYDEDEIDGEERTVMRLVPEMAPVDVAVFPLMTKEGLDEKARTISDALRESGLSVNYDDSGAIGRRYRRQDEIGTPLCVTVDHQTLEDDTVTLRDRDTTEQIRVELDELESAIKNFREGNDLSSL
ncbi:MAG: glycine--tRNA ligase [Candidatus Nanohaloarchaea archaeon]